MRSDLIKEAQLKTQSEEFLVQFHKGLESGELKNVKIAAWEPTLSLLSDFSRQRERMGFSPSETALFIFSLKEPLFDQLRKDIKADPGRLMEQMAAVSALLDKLGLHTMEVYQVAREDVIRRQQEELLELSTPVVKLCEGIVALPLIGTLDSARTQTVMPGKPL